MKKRHVIPSLFTAERVILLHIETPHNLQQLQLQVSTTSLTSTDVWTINSAVNVITERVHLVSLGTTALSCSRISL